MKRRIAVLAAVFAASLVLGGCSAGMSGGGDTPVIAPVTMDVNDLQGADVDLKVGGTLNINTGDLAPDSYSGEVSDTGVAEFVAGGEKDGATFNPGVRALKAGETDVVLSNSDGGIEDVTFTVTVTE